MVNNELERVLTKMAVNEETIGQLYLLYAARFLSHKSLWETLAAEERGHAAILRSCIKKIGELPPDEEVRFPEEAVDTFTDYVEREKENAKIPELTVARALITALYIEQGLLESKYLDVLPPEQCCEENPFDQLKRETQEHARRVKEALFKERENR